MKGIDVIFKMDENDYSEDEKYGTVISEPYPLITASQFTVPRNGAAFVGSNSVTCVIVRVGDVLVADVPVSNLTPNN